MPAACLGRSQPSSTCLERRGTPIVTLFQSSLQVRRHPFTLLTLNRLSRRTRCLVIEATHPSLVHHSTFHRIYSFFSFSLYLYNASTLPCSLLPFVVFFPPCKTIVRRHAPDGANPWAFELTLAKQKGPNSLSKRLVSIQEVFKMCPRSYLRPKWSVR